MGVILASLAPFIPTAIQIVESLFAGKPKSGPEKLDTAVAILRALASKFVGTGLGGTTPTTPQPTDDALQGAVEAIFQQMKPAGAEKQPTVPVDAGQWILAKTTQWIPLPAMKG